MKRSSWERESREWNLQGVRLVEGEIHKRHSVLLHVVQRHPERVYPARLEIRGGVNGIQRYLTKRSLLSDDATTTGSNTKLKQDNGADVSESESTRRGSRSHNLNVLR